MLRTAFLSLILFVSLSSTSLLRKSISRRQADAEVCHAIEGFDCKCSYYRVTCTSDRNLPSSINVVQNEKQKYHSVELVINGEHEQHVYEYTFEPVKQLYKPDVDNLEFRIKFEKFTQLHLSSPSIFNRVFPDNLSSDVRKSMALEIYNPLVQPTDDLHLFANLNVDSLELYVLYPFRGTFQQLFSGANIKFLRLSGGDIRSDLSKPFTGNVGRLEVAKQASQLSIQNFPAYPAHELIINAFYVADFTSDHPPNYSNLGELRVYTQEHVPANAFRNYPNLHTLSITTDKTIDPHALDGLYNLEKLSVKDSKPSLDILDSVPSVKEFESSIDKFSAKDQCELVEKLANGYVAVQAFPNGQECTCVSAYLETTSGRYACEAQDCEKSSCAAIKNNFDATTRTFKTPPNIKRADGSDALRPREQKTYTSPYQVSHQDQEKVQQASPHPGQGQEDEGQHSETDVTHTATTSNDQQDAIDQPNGELSDESKTKKPDEAGQHAEGSHDDGVEPGTSVDGDGSQKDGEGAENQEPGEGDHDHSPSGDSNQSTEASATDAISPTAKKFNWLPVIVAVAGIALLLLIIIIIIIVKKRRSGYSKANTSDNAAVTTPKA